MDLGKENNTFVIERRDLLLVTEPIVHLSLWIIHLGMGSFLCKCILPKLGLTFDQPSLDQLSYVALC